MLISLESVTKTFQGCFYPILNKINLFVEKGDFCIIIGMNGSGKSTLLKTINNEYKIDSGKINVLGKISQVTQDVNIGTIPSLSILENFSLSLMSSQKAKPLFYKRYSNYIKNKLKELDLNYDLNMKVQNLSGGQRQVLATIMALNSDSNIILLDEHTSALDPKMQKFLMEYTAKEIKRLNLTALMITHKMSDAIKYGNRIIVLNKGEIVMDIRQDEKSKLTENDLLEIFHKYEDKDLI